MWQFLGSFNPCVQPQHGAAELEPATPQLLAWPDRKYTLDPRSRTNTHRQIGNYVCHPNRRWMRPPDRVSSTCILWYHSQLFLHFFCHLWVTFSVIRRFCMPRTPDRIGVGGWERTTGKSEIAPRPRRSTCDTRGGGTSATANCRPISLHTPAPKILPKTESV